MGFPTLDPPAPAGPAHPYRARLAAVARTCSEQGWTGLIVTDPINIQYLTGFTGFAPLLLLTDDESHLLVDPRYRLRAYQEVSAAQLDSVSVQPYPSGQWQDLLRRLKPSYGTVGLEDSTPWSFQRSLGEILSPGIDLVPSERLVEGVRLVKDSSEIARMTAAAAIADAAIAAVRSCDVTGWTEIQLRKFISDRMQDLGAADGFDFVVATGLNTALPHARPSRARIDEDSLVLIDIGARLDGYLSDISRPLVWGDVSPPLMDLYRAVEHAHRTAAECLVPGATYRTVDNAARKALESAGYGAYFTHPTGHNLGLTIHERPYFSAGHEGELQAGNVVTIEPGAYIEGLGGMRLEDMYLIEDDGARRLTHATRSLHVV